MRSVDVAVIGAGPAGSVAALVLRRIGLSTVIVDAGCGGQPRVGETAPPGLRVQLMALELWERFGEVPAVPSFANKSAWGSDQLAEQSFVINPHGHGWHLDRAAFDASLLAAARAAGARVLRGVRVRGVVATAGGYRIECGEHAEGLMAGGVIDATGRGATVARGLGGRRLVVDRLVGLVARHHAPGARPYTLVEAVPEGWWYCAPVPGQGMVTMLMTDADLWARQQQPGIAAWYERLAATRHTRARLAQAGRADALEIVAAVSQRLHAPPGDRRWVAVGDAAIGVDPLAASGIVRAVETGAAGARALARRLAGDATALEAFEDGLDRAFARYLARRRDHYTQEARFATEPFWQRRGARPEPRSTAVSTEGASTTM